MNNPSSASFASRPVVSKPVQIEIERTPGSRQVVVHVAAHAVSFIKEEDAQRYVRRLMDERQYVMV